MKYAITIIVIIFITGLSLSQNTENHGPPPPPPPAANVSPENQVFRVVEKVPEFKGGEEAMYAFINSNVHYPQEALKNKEEGKVFVEFLIDKKGNLSNFKVIKGATKSLNEEALRVLKLMPRWIPGEQRGKKVNCVYIIPINFKIG